MSERPKSVVVVAGFLFFATAIAVFVSSSLLFPNQVMYRLWELNWPGETVFVSIHGPASLFLIALGMGTCAAGSGLLRGRRWAWWFAMVLFAMDACGDVVSFVVTREILRAAIGVSLSGMFLVLLAQGRVRHWFLSDCS